MSIQTLELMAYAKLNLTLDVLSRRPDGYHDMRMVMQSVSLADTVTLEWGRGPGIRVITDRTDLPEGRENLAAAAAYAFRSAAGQTWNDLTITIQKRIPVQAGTAGGSSDAAAVLRGLNQLTGAGLSPKELARIGELVGSDVPYCVLGGTMLAEGRGEILTPLPPLPPCRIVLSKPDFGISTPDLFRAADRAAISRRPDTDRMRGALERGDLAGVAGSLCNVFEEVLPEPLGRKVRELKARMDSAGALGAGMSGSGPTVFGIFDNDVKAAAAVDQLKKDTPETFLTEPV